MPICVATSDRHGGGPIYNASYSRSDVILEPELVHAAADQLGTDVAHVRVPGALHDIWLSSPVARSLAYTELLSWLDVRWRR